MDALGNHHSQQTAENQTPHVVTHRRVMNNENTWTQGGEHHRVGSVGGWKGGTAEAWKGQGGIMGRNARYR